MEKLTKNTKEVLYEIGKKTGNSPDIIIKKIMLFNTNIYIIMAETMADKTYIDDYVLKFFANEKINEKKIEKPDNVLEYLEQVMTTHKITRINNYDDLFYSVLSGFSIILVEGYDNALSLETRAKLDSGINQAQNEMVAKGPKDAFTENYQTNIGLIRRRIKSEDLWLEELTLGTKSKTKVGIMYIKGVASQEIVDYLVKKLKNINIDSIVGSSYVIELISENKKSLFANYISTERPDLAGIYLLDGRIAIVVENTQYVVVIPALFVDFFQTSEDFYQKVSNVNFTRIIRLIAFIIALIGPAVYVAVATYNIEGIPDRLLLNLAVQRQGVPFPTIFETLMMIAMFEITRETDTRIPNAIGSSLSIVGAIVLGQAAVTAGIVSPITIIVAGATSISGMISYNMDMVNGVRWWRIIFLLFAGVLGIFGIAIAGFLLFISVSSIKSFGVPFLSPIAPFIKEEQDNAIFLTNKYKFEKRNPLTTKNNQDRQSGGK